MTEKFASHEPLIFLRTAWMTSYQGLSDGDTPQGGGKHVREHGHGEEIFNFRPFKGRVYGGCRPSGGTSGRTDARIVLEQIGGNRDDTSVSGVVVVWVATPKSGGTRIVGWYKNATVYREWQPPPIGSDRITGDTDCGFYVSAREEDAHLLVPDERRFVVGQQKKRKMGRSNVWYAKGRDWHPAYRDEVLKYVGLAHQPKRNPNSPSQGDPLLRQRVEEIAVQVTTEHFAALDYCVTSIERDNVGWDLDAAIGSQNLRLEVKGLSGRETVVELTPNEYLAMRNHRDTYRVCVVTNALDQPRLQIFSYHADLQQWKSDEGQLLKLDEIVAVRCTAQ